MRPLQLAHLKLYLENAIELEAHRHGVFNGSRSPSLQSVGVSDESAILPRFHTRTNSALRRVVGYPNRVLSQVTYIFFGNCLR